MIKAGRREYVQVLRLLETFETPLTIFRRIAPRTSRPATVIWLSLRSARLERGVALALGAVGAPLDAVVLFLSPG